MRRHNDSSTATRFVATHLRVLAAELVHLADNGTLPPGARMRDLMALLDAPDTPARLTVARGLVEDAALRTVADLVPSRPQIRNVRLTGSTAEIEGNGFSLTVPIRAAAIASAELRAIGRDARKRAQRHATIAARLDAGAAWLQAQAGDPASAMDCTPIAEVAPA